MGKKLLLVGGLSQSVNLIIFVQNIRIYKRYSTSKVSFFEKNILEKIVSEKGFFSSSRYKTTLSNLVTILIRNSNQNRTVIKEDSMFNVHISHVSRIEINLALEGESGADL